MKYLDVLVSIGVVLGLVVGGFFIFVKYWSSEKKDTEKDADQAADRLIKILGDNIKVLESKVQTLEKQQHETHREIIKLQGENTNMREILQGRDARSIEMYSLVKTTNENVERLYQVVDKHLAIMETFLNKFPSQK